MIRRRQALPSMERKVFRHATPSYPRLYTHINGKLNTCPPFSFPSPFLVPNYTMIRMRRHMSTHYWCIFRSVGIWARVCKGLNRACKGGFLIVKMPATKMAIITQRCNFGLVKSSSQNRIPDCKNA